MKHFLLGFFLILFFIPSGNAQALYPVISIDSSLLEKSDAVVRLHRKKIDLNRTDMSIESKRVVTVLNKAGQDAVNSYLHYNDSRKIRDLEAVVYDAWGNEIRTFKERDFKDEGVVPNGMLYSGVRFKYINYKPPAYPYTIALTYTLKTDNTAFFPGFLFIGGYNVGVEKSEYILNYDKNELSIRIKEENFRNYKIEKSETLTGIVYTAVNLFPIKEEALGPSVRGYAPKIMVSPNTFHISGYVGNATDWDSFGSWMFHDILEGRADLPESVKRKMQVLTNQAENSLEKARIIYNYVQENTRYISIQVGIGGIQPIPASEVHRLKYGDCKGLTNYTMALLKSVGVPSYYTHVESGSAKIDFENDFASLAQGDHVILALPYEGKLFWADCTSDSSPFGYLGSFTDDRQVLMITPEGGKLARTPKYVNKSNYQKTTGNIVLGENGNMTGEVQIISKGIPYGYQSNLESLSVEDLEKHYKNKWDHIRNLNLTGHQFLNDESGPKFTQTLQLSAGNYATKAGNYLFFDLNPLNKNDYVPPSYSKRITPFHIARGYFYENEIHFQIPENYKIESVPKSIALKNEFGSYRFDLEIKNKKLIYKKSLFLKAGQYPKERYKAYRKFRAKIADYENANISLVKTI